MTAVRTRYRLVAVSIAALFVMLAAPGANAACVWCDASGCHVSSGACGGAAFTGSADFECFGCGVTSGSAVLQIIDGTLATAGPRTAASGTAWATFTSFEPPATCPVTGAAAGQMTGALNVSFNWTRVGAVAVINTTGEINGSGVMTFAVTSPLGNPCGQRVTATIAGAITGT